MEILKLLSANEIIAQIISFLVLFFVLRAFAWKPVLRFLDERRERISAEFDNIARQQAKIEELRAGYEAHMRSIDETAKSRLQEAAAAGQKLIENATKEAHAAALKIVEKAQGDAMHEVDRARQQLKSEIAELAVQAAERVIEEKISDASDRKIAEEFLSDLERMEKI